MTAATFPALLQGFFMDRLLGQLDASPHTVAAYRDAFRLLLRFAEEHLGRAPSAIRLMELDVPFLGQFLNYLEKDRGNSTKTRNTRLTALHAFFHYVAFSEPAYALQCRRVLAIPAKRHERGPVEFLTEEETAALVEAPDTSTWIGRRDHAVLHLTVQTGLRNSEITSLRRQDIELGTGAHVRCFGKGRKTRLTPLRPDVTEILAAWLNEAGGALGDPVFPSLHGGFLSADALQRLVARHTATACKACPSLVGRSVTPHTLRHTMAMDLLRRGVDVTVIALWLGHESTETTQIYLHADMRIKERALAHATPSGSTPDRFRPSDALLTFLQDL